MAKFCPALTLPRCGSLCRNSSVQRQKSGRLWSGSGMLFPRSGLRALVLPSHITTVPGVFPGPKKTVGHGVYDPSPWSVHTHEYHKAPQQGRLSLRSPHGPGFSECKLVNECELSRWPLSLPESSGRQFRLGGGSGLASYAHNTHTYDQSASTGSPRTQLKKRHVCLCVHVFIRECACACVCA